MVRLNGFFRYFIMIGVVFLFTGCLPQEKEKETETKKEAAVPPPSESFKKAPDFTLTKVLDGEYYSLSDASGKVILLDFWATWCPPCKASIPNMNRLYDKYSEKGFEIIGVSVDRIQNVQDEKKVKDFIRRYNMKYPVVYVENSMRSMYGGISSVPTIFIINREGEIVSKYTGYSPVLEKKMEETIVNLL